MGRRGVISSFKLFLPVFAKGREEGRESAPCGEKSNAPAMGGEGGGAQRPDLYVNNTKNTGANSIRARSATKSH